jgi:hypothetical protein
MTCLTNRRLAWRLRAAGALTESPADRRLDLMDTLRLLFELLTPVSGGRSPG